MINSCENHIKNVIDYYANNISKISNFRYGLRNWQLPFKDCSFDVVFLFDFLKHSEDDVAFLKEMGLLNSKRSLEYQIVIDYLID